MTISVASVLDRGHWFLYGPLTAPFDQALLPGERLHETWFVNVEALRIQPR